MNKTTRSILTATAIVAVSAGVAGLTSYALMQPEQDQQTMKFEDVFQVNPNTSLAALDATEMQPVDLTKAAESSVNAVVHIKSTQESKTQTVTVRDPFYEFFGDMFGNRGGQQRQVQTPEKVGFGSGVIISKDGYIVTNNHVVENADNVTVTLNDNREFSAKIIGTDPTTDLALIKIEGSDFPTLIIGDSDALKVGEWVLAVGNPFNLTSTVTAGIVSAKARHLGANGIESFIQTDAAVNPGNSGGALVNTRGGLVGSNTAIASNTGSFTGYSFAVPVAIVKKVVDDIRKHGSVQRALLGIAMQELTQELASLAGMKGNFSGVYVAEVSRGSAADDAGVQEGDILVAINGKKVKAPSDVQATVNSYKPGDSVKLLVYRDSKEIELDAILGAAQGSVAVNGENEPVVMGATLGEPDKDLLARLRLRGGVEVKELGKGKFKDAGVQKGLIITHINQMPVSSVKEALEVIGKTKRGFLVEGVYRNGDVYYYGVGV